MTNVQRNKVSCLLCVIDFACTVPSFEQPLLNRNGKQACQTNMTKLKEYKVLAAESVTEKNVFVMCSAVLGGVE